MTDKIGKYEIRNEIGHGGFGHVYAARDPGVNRLVAIKVLISADDPEILARFRAEAAAAGRLRHKNIVTIYDYGEQDGLPYLVMEYLEGQTLQQILQTPGQAKLSLLDKINIMSQTAEGLHCAHQNGIVHRDVKPSNIMVLRDGSVKILDFGIARAMQSDTTRRTRTGFLIGTLAYMCPEQFQGEQVDARSDIWSYGVIYYELVAGTHPFQATDPATLMYRITNVEPASIATLIADCPDPLPGVLRRALAKDPALRYHSLQELLYDTEPVLIDLKREKASAMAAEAKRLLEQGDVTAANAMVRTMLALDSTNREARQLRETIQEELQRRILKPRLEALVKTAEESLAQRQFLEAIQSFDAALRLDSTDAAIRTRMEQAQADYERSQRAAELIAEARQKLAREDTAAAQRIAEEALRVDPRNPQAAEIFDAIHRAIAQRERERERAAKIEGTVRQAREFLSYGNFQRAVDTLMEGVGEFPGEAVLAKLLSDAQSAKAEYERKQEIQRVLRRAGELRDAQRVAEALEVVETALRKSGEAPELSALRAELVEEQKRQNIRRAAKTGAHELLKAGRPAEAMELLSRNAATGGAADAELTQLMAQIAEMRREQLRAEREQRMRALAAGIEAKLKGQNWDAALQLIAAAQAEFPDEAGFERLLAQARDGRARSSARQARMQVLLREIQQKFNAKDWDAALPLIVAAQAEFPEEAGFQRLQARALEGQRTVREVRIQALIVDIERTLAGQDWDRALELVQAAQAQFASEGRFQWLLSRAQEGQRAKVAEREARLQSLITEIEQKLAKEDWDAALQMTLAAQAEFAAEGRLQRLLARAQEGQRARFAARETRIQTLAAGIEQKFKAEDWDAVYRLSQAAQAEFPTEVRFQRLVARAQEGQRTRAAAREARLQTLSAQIERQLTSQDWDTALRSIQQALAEFPGDAGLKGLSDRAKAGQRAKIAEDRESRLRTQIAAIEQEVVARNWETALRMITAAKAEFLGEVELERLLVRAKEGQRAQMKAQAKAAAAAPPSPQAVAVPASRPPVAAPAVPANVPAPLVDTPETAPQTPSPQTWELAEPKQALPRRLLFVVVTVLALAAAGWFVIERGKLAERRSALSVSTAPLAFRFQLGAATHPSAGLLISGEGGSFKVHTESTWITLNPASGKAPQTVQATIDPFGLRAGKYNGSIVVEGTEGTHPHTVPVTLEVTAAKGGRREPK